MLLERSIYTGKRQMATDQVSEDVLDTVINISIPKLKKHFLDCGTEQTRLAHSFIRSSDPVLKEEYEALVKRKSTVLKLVDVFLEDSEITEATRNNVLVNFPRVKKAPPNPVIKQDMPATNDTEERNENGQLVPHGQVFMK